MFQKGKLFSSVLSSSLHAILLSGLFLSVSVSGDAKSELDALTGGIHTRVAWREGGHQISGGSKIIKGFDSKTGETHTIWSDGAVKSVLAAGGNKLLVTSGDYNVWVVDWDGTNKKQLATGSVSDGWHDPETGKDWAIYRGNGGVFRVQIDDPSQTVQIYKGAEGHKVYPWFQISADGKKGASFFPWGGKNGGVLDIATGKLTKVTGGCWSGMASDNSYHWFRLAGSHTSLEVFKDTKKLGQFNAMPPIKGGQIYCPRAAEGPEKGGSFITLSGGYPGYNKNGNTVEVFIGKMNAGFTNVTGWARITNNNVADHHPTVWIGVKAGSSASTSMSLSSGKLSITATEGASTVESKTITVTPEKGELENVTAESDKPWLKVTVKKAENKWEIENKPDVTGLSAEIHKATVTIKASNAEPPEKTYEVELTVEGAARLTTLKVSPPTTMVKAGNTQTFDVKGIDQFDKPVSTLPSITWSASNDAKINDKGEFTAPEKTGEYTITAKAGDIKGTAKVNVVTLEITSEHDDKSYGIGDKVTVKWSASDEITGTSLWISIDKGRTWMIINKDASIDVKDNKGTYTWKIPDEFDGKSLEDTEAMFRVSDYWQIGLNDKSKKFTISSTAISVKRISALSRPLSMKMTGPRTLDLHVNHKGSFDIEFIDPKGKTVEKFSGNGPVSIRWIGETAGVYMVRLNSRRGQLNKKVIMW